MSQDFDPEERQLALETQLAQLQRHVEQQDKEMFTLSEKIRRLEREITTSRQRIGALEEGHGGGAPASERPPHY